MGIAGLWAYGEDIGSAIETAENVLAKIKTNRFDTEDLSELRLSLLSVCDELEKAVNSANNEG